MGISENNARINAKGQDEMLMLIQDNGGLHDQCWFCLIQPLAIFSIILPQSPPSLSTPCLELISIFSPSISHLPTVDRGLISKSILYTLTVYLLIIVIITPTPYKLMPSALLTIQFISSPALSVIVSTCGKRIDCLLK